MQEKSGIHGEKIRVKQIYPSSGEKGVIFIPGEERDAIHDVFVQHTVSYSCVF